jgi:hypothetical protein
LPDWRSFNRWHGLTVRRDAGQDRLAAEETAMMKRWIASAGLAVVLAATAFSADARSVNKDRINGCQYGSSGDWVCQPGGMQYAPYGFYRQDSDSNWKRDWHKGHRIVSTQYVQRQLISNGFSRIYDIRLDDDSQVYKVRAYDRKGRLVKLFVNAANGAVMSKSIAD